MGPFNSILILITFVLFLLTEYRPAFRKNVVVTAVQVTCFATLVGWAIAIWLEPDHVITLYGIYLIVLLATALLVRAFRNQ
jgi:hypothetical protein